MSGESSLGSVSGSSAPLGAIRQLLNKGYVVIKLDYHEAIKTSAYTKWVIPSSALWLYCTKSRNKTHWYEYYIIPSTEILIRIRKSNRGNVSSDKYLASELKLSDKELEELLVILEEA
jgi:hypothetical protein